MAIFYDAIPKSPFGVLHIAQSEAGLVAIGIGESEEAFVRRLSARFGAPVQRDPERLSQSVFKVASYLAGEKSRLDLPLDLRHLSKFQREVLLLTKDIPRGKVLSYGEIARRLGKEGAARAVGQALARNPIPIVIPCHRVLAADGALGGYSGGKGIETKKQLLELEGALD